jgi:soluble lytic murein transglycosylase-like protein
MQLMPGTADAMGVADPFDPVENIIGGTKYLSRLLDTLDGNLPLALAAYNAGPLRVIGKNRIPLIPETRDYVARVLRYYKKFNHNEF